MKVKSLLIALLFLLICNKSNGQIMLPNSEFDLNKNGPNMIYYKFYNGIQMIEIDYNNYEKARVDLEDAKNPINSIRPRFYGHNTIILRNKNGVLLHQYNLRGAPFKASDFIACDKTTITLTHLMKINSNYGAKSNYPSYGKYNYYVTENNKSGVLDTIGEPILEVVYDNIQSYYYTMNSFEISTKFRNNEIDSNCVYTMKINEKWGFKSNKTTVMPKYDELVPIKENVFLFKKNDKYGLLNFKEKIVLAPIYSNLIYKKDFYLYANESKNSEENNRKYGIINSKFKTITKPIYSNIEDIIENYRTSGKYWAFKTEGFGAINQNGNEISLFKYGETPQNPYQKFYRTNAYTDSNKRYILDLNFKEIGTNYDNVYDWKNDIFIVIKNSKMGLMDLNNKEILPCEYQSITNDFNNNLSLIKKNESFGVINSSGKIIIPCIYYNLWIDNSGLIHAQIKDETTAFGDTIKFGLLKNTGEIGIPLAYDSLESLGYGFWKVQIKDKFGIVTDENKEITPIKYDKIYPLENGFCIAKIDFGYGYINSSGKEITHFYYEKPTNFTYNSENKLTAKAFLAGKEVTIDENGKQIN